MSTTSDASSIDQPTHEQVRQQFLAACVAGNGPLPDIESFVAAFAEPQRSSLRSELEALQRAHARPTTSERAGDTRDENPDPAGTVDYPAADSGTADGAAPGGTVDYVPAPPGTVDHARRVKRSADVPVPQSVAGYEILGVLGRGAMGVVYKARQRGLKRLVALKMILSGEHASALDLRRFSAEANAVARLQHPGIVQIYEVGEDAGRPFFSLELVDGASLHKKIQGTPLPPAEAARLLQHMAVAMAYAHQHGVIHRDLKPANVLLTSDGMPKIGDFGLAKEIEERESGLTRTGTVLGTPSYMSPEQAQGQPDEVGPLADVYSLGAILYDMLTGRPPFRGTSVLDTLEQLRTREPVPPMQFQPGVPRDLETICLKCLQKDRARRYASAGDLAADLGRFLRGEPILARPVTKVERTVRWCRRNPGKAATIVLAILGVASYILSVTVLAGMLKVEKDAADDAREKAVEARNVARENEREANRQVENQRKTATQSMIGMADVSDQLFNVLQDKRLSLNASPEVKKLRAKALDDLRNQLENISKKVQNASTDTFANLLMTQLIGDRMHKLGQADKARETFEAGRKATRERAALEPNSDKARANLGIIEQRLGDVALELEGDARTARGHYVEARRLHEEVQRQPKSGEYTPRQIQIALGHDDVHLGRALVALGQATAARQYLEEALRYRQEWSDDDPKNAEPRSYIMEARMWLGIVAWHVGDSKAAEEQSGAALAIGRDLQAKFPDYLPFFAELAEVLGACGDVQLRLGKPAAAHKHYQDSLDKLNVVLAKNPDAIEHQPLLALTHERLGQAHALLKEDAGAAKHFKQAMQLRKELWEIDPKNPARQIGFVLALARAGERPDATRLVATLRTRPYMTKSTELMLQMARCSAVLSIGNETTRRKHIEDALADLATATGEEYKDAPALQTDADLAALRDEAGFKDLIGRIAAR
jgi:serine/threonine-protein kinase